MGLVQWMAGRRVGRDGAGWRMRIQETPGGSAGSASVRRGADARRGPGAAASSRARTGDRHPRGGAEDTRRPAGVTLDRRVESRVAAAGLFEYDSAELSTVARAALDANAATLRKYPGWVITVEGHCDERGTAEYNSALGERRAASARTLPLVSLGIPAERLHIVSYGKEFPFDPGHAESAWAKNRRAHFVITSK